MLPEADKGNRISEMFTSSVPRCSIKTIILVQNEEGDPIGDDAIVKIKDDFLVTDVSKGKSSMTHIYYLQATTIAGIQLTEKVNITFGECAINKLSAILQE